MLRGLKSQAVTKRLMFMLVLVVMLALAGQTIIAQNADSQSAPATASKPRVLEFSAVWCAPCKKFAPIFEKVKSKYESKAAFESYDIEKGKGPSFRQKYNIIAVPTVIVLDGRGQLVFQHSGVMTEEDLSAVVDKVAK